MGIRQTVLQSERDGVKRDRGIAHQLNALACQVACAAIFVRIIALGQQPESQQLRRIGCIGGISAVFKSALDPQLKFVAIRCRDQELIRVHRRG